MPRVFATFRFWKFCVVATLFSACASQQVEWAKEPYHTRIYSGRYDQVWVSALKALNDYTLKISNKDVGKVHSEVINGPYNDLLFAYPEPIELPERFRYSLKLNFAKLETDARQPAVRIRVIKELERYQDFYTGWVAFPSDGLEEKVLLYRIEHILRMEERLGKVDGSPSSDNETGKESPKEEEEK